MDTKIVDVLEDVSLGVIGELELIGALSKMYSNYCTSLTEISRVPPAYNLTDDFCVMLDRYIDSIKTHINKLEDLETELRAS